MPQRNAKRTIRFYQNRNIGLVLTLSLASTFLLLNAWLIVHGSQENIFAAFIEATC